MSRKLLRHYILCLALAASAALVPFVPGQTPSVSGADSPILTVAPTTALPNQYVAITGDHFTTGGSAKLASLTIGSVLVDSEKINYGSPVNLDTSGRFVTNLVVPLNNTTLAGGSLIVKATDSSGVTASATLVISTPTISVSPASGRAGSMVKVTGSNFPVESYNLGTDPVPSVSIRYYVTAFTYEQVATVYPNSTGAFTADFKVPSNALIPSDDNTVEAFISGSSTTAVTKHSVAGPAMTVTPASGDPGAQVVITGDDFKAFRQVKSLTIGPEQIEGATSNYTDADGKITLTATIPKLEPGTQPISMQVGETTYTVIFTVTGTASFVAKQQTPSLPTTFQLDSQLSPLGQNVVRIYHFDNATKQWSFYDPDPQLLPFSTLTELSTGKAYWIKVKRAQATAVAGVWRDLFEGWNLVSW